MLQLCIQTSKWCTTQSNTTISTNCTTSTKLLPSGIDNSIVTWSTSFNLQQWCHYFVSKPCICDIFIQSVDLSCYYAEEPKSFEQIFYWKWFVLRLLKNIQCMVCMLIMNLKLLYSNMIFIDCSHIFLSI